MLARPIIRPLVRPLVRAVTDMGYGGWSPLRLFAAGEQGAWYDPSDLSSMNTKHDGSGAVPGVGDPVGYIADKSGRGNHAKQTTDTARPTLQLASGRYYLQFDGVDDFLSTAAIDFTATDKMTVVAGVRKLSDAARGLVVELTNASTNRFGMEAPGAGLNNFLWATGGTSVPANVSYAIAAPSTKVLTGIGDISADTAILRADGAQVASQTNDQGTGNYANAVLYIGRRGGATLPFNGNLYSLLIRGAASTAAQIASAERYAAVNAGVIL